MIQTPKTRASTVEGRPGVYAFEPAGGSLSEPAAGRPAARSGPVVRERLWPALLERGRELGVAKMGALPALDFSDAGAALKRWLDAGFGGEMRYLEAPSRSDPRLLLPEAKSVLVIAMAHARSPDRAAPSRLGGTVASYAQGPDYHGVLRQTLLELGQWLSEALGRAILGRVCVDTAPLLERAAAAKAGIAFTGKSTLSIAPGMGSFFLLGELLLDVDLPFATTQIKDGCGRCEQCLSACPTGAFPAPYVIDARRCISYLTIELAGSIPRDLRAPIGRHVFGCDICQRVCPYNHSKKPPGVATKLEPWQRLDAPDLIDLLELTSSGYRRLVKGTALRRTSRRQLQRNAAVALGNAGDRRAVQPLFAALDSNPSPLVREHAAWALGALGGDAVLDGLRERLRTELDPVVRGEMAFALRGSDGSASLEAEPPDPPPR